MRRIVITVIVLGVVAGLTTSSALASSRHLKKGREGSCVITVPAISTSVACRGVVDSSAGALDNGNGGSALPYDEFGLAANQPNQPQVGSDGTQTRRDQVGLTAPTGASDNDDVNTNGGSALPYDEYGLAANQPNQPRVGGNGP
jgi:hypothetical protein